MSPIRLLPTPRSIARRTGAYTLPARTLLFLEAALPRDTVLLPIADRLRAVLAPLGIELEIITGEPLHPRLAIRAVRSFSAPDHSEGYSLTIDRRGVAIEYRETGGLRAAVATLRQLLREYGRRLPHLRIRDYPDFAKRGVMLDISRGRVPRLETLLALVDDLADFKINEFQLYTEHTFAFRNFEPVWRDWGALTGDEILRLDARCRQLGIELVPNQNSFGHLRHWLAHPPLKALAETQMPYEDGGGAFLRYPSTLAPRHPGTLPFLRGLYDELLQYFTSRRFNVGCDETWDLGKGQSRGICATRGKGRVYVDFLKRVHRELSTRGWQMMFWGDIILHHPDLLRELPRDLVALNWGYEAGHPFDREANQFRQSGLPFYVCPGTSTWMSLIGRHDNAFANLRQAAMAGLKHDAQGYLITDWGDGGHPQPLAVSYLPYLLGAAMSWCLKTFDEGLLIPVLSRDIFHDPTGRLARATWNLGFAHRKFEYFAPNETPFGTVITAPPPERRELFCRNGLQYYTRIPEKPIRAALGEVVTQTDSLRTARPSTPSGNLLQLELELAARMAAQSCKFMLWQQALAAGLRPARPRNCASAAKAMARSGIRELKELNQEFERYWPRRNKGSTAFCSAFLHWRIQDYQHGRLHLPRNKEPIA